MKILRFEINAPVAVTLKCDGGRAVTGQYGPQVLYTLEDGRLMYLEPKVARRIEELKITAGEPFSICKHEVKNGQKAAIEWDVRRLPTTARLELVPLTSGNEPGTSTAKPRAGGTVSGSPAQSSVGEVTRTAGVEKPPALTACATEQLEIQLRASIPGIAKLEHALKTAIAAAAGAEQFGHQMGYAVRFTPDDIRALAITVFEDTGKQR